MNWDRVFLTGEHLNHEGRFSWRSSKPCSTFCLTCAVDIFTNVDRLTVEKKHVLIEFLNQLATNRPEVTAAMNGNLPCARRAIFALIDLIQHHDQELTAFASEGVLQLMDVIDSVEVTEHVLENVVIRVCEVRDHQLHSKTLDLLSRLVRRQRHVAQRYVTVAGGRFLGFLKSALVHAADDIKSSAVSMLVLLLRELGWTSTFDPLMDALPSDVIRMLRNTSNKDLQMNCLALVRLMTYHPAATQELLTVDVDGATLPDILKKTLLTRDRRLVQEGVHCVATLLKCPQAPFAALLLRDDVVPFLFECLGCVDDALVGSILRCCLELTENELFFTECYTVYGIDSILRATEFALNFQHFQCLDLAFQLLTAIFVKQPKNLPLFNYSAKVLQVLKSIKGGVETPFGTVALSAIRALSAFLRRDHLLCPVPFPAIQEAVRCALDAVCELTGSSMAPPYFDEQLAAVIFCVNALQRLCQECFEDQICFGASFEVDGSPSDELDDLQRFIAQICDQIFVPLILTRRNSLANLDVFHQFFGCLVLLLDTRNSAWTTDSVTKVVTSGFLVLACDGYSIFQQDMRVGRKDVYFDMRNSFLAKYLRYLIARDWNLTKDEEEAIFVHLQNGIVHLYGLPRHFLDVFVRDCDFTGNGSAQEAAQATLLTLCYFVALYDQSFIPSAILLPALCHLLIMRQLHLDLINMKCVLFLIAVNSVGWTESHLDVKASIPNYNQAVQALLSEIQRSKSPCRFYTHHKAFLKWIFSSDDVTRVIGRTTFQSCLQNSFSDNRASGQCDLGEVMTEMLDQCETFAQVFLESLIDEDPVLVNIAMKAFENLKLKENSRAMVMEKMPNILARNLTNDDTSFAYENLEILMKWLAGYLISVNAESSPSDFDFGDGHLSLLHQVTKVATRGFDRKRFSIVFLAFQCLNFLLEKFHLDGDTRGQNYEIVNRGVNILLLDTNCLCTLEEALNGGIPYEESHFNMDALMLLVTLIRNQTKFGLTFCKRIVIDFSVVRLALFSSSEPPILIGLQICVDFIRRIDSLSNFFGMENITNIPNFSEESSESATYNDDFALLDLRALYAVLLNLLFKEFQNEKVQALALECIQAVILSANRIDGIACGLLVSQYWTGMAVEMMLPKMEGNFAFLQFIHSVLYFSSSTSGDDIWIEIWSKNFQTIISQFEESQNHHVLEVKLHLKLLYQILAFSKTVPNLQVDRQQVENLISEFEILE